MADLSGTNNSEEPNEPVHADLPDNPTTGDEMRDESTPSQARPEVPTREVSTTVNDMSSTDTTMNFSQEFAAQIASIDSNVTAEEQESIAALPSGSALMVVRRGPNAGARFLLDANHTSVGRHPNADIFLDDVTVSRRHADFLRIGTAFTVKDLGSLNGTYFNGERIETAVLSDGAEVQVGKFRLTFYASRLDLARAASE